MSKIDRLSVAMGILNFELKIGKRCKNMLSRIRIFFFVIESAVCLNDLLRIQTKGLPLHFDDFRQVLVLDPDVLEYPPQQDALLIVPTRYLPS